MSLDLSEHLSRCLLGMALHFDHELGLVHQQHGSSDSRTGIGLWKVQARVLYKKNSLLVLFEGVVQHMSTRLLIASGQSFVIHFLENERWLFCFVLGLCFVIVFVFIVIVVFYLCFCFRFRFFFSVFLLLLMLLLLLLLLFHQHRDCHNG